MNTDEALKKFFDVFEGMKGRLGPVLIQLPPGLSYDRSLIFDFFSLLKHHGRNYSFAVEVRNKSWLNDDFFNLLKEFGIAFVIADSGNRYPYYEITTADFVYCRFHGPEQLYASDYSEADLKVCAEKLKTFRNQGKESWVFFNNDFHGFAVKNAERLREIIDTR